MRTATYPFLICEMCLTVDGIGPFVYCTTGDGAHWWRPAEVTECPFLDRTPKGRVTLKRAVAADTACTDEGDDYECHNFDDPQRRHFRVPQRFLDGKVTRNGAT